MRKVRLHSREHYLDMSCNFPGMCLASKEVLTNPACDFLGTHKKHNMVFRCPASLEGSRLHKLLSRPGEPELGGWPGGQRL